MMLSCKDLPLRDKNSRTLSKFPESEQLASIIGNSFVMESPYKLDANEPSLALIQLIFPLIVLISPLCDIQRLGIARSQLGKVLVEKRE